MAKKGYTSKDDIENYMLEDIDVSFDTQIDRWIEGVENMIDKITGRNFIADALASARVFDGDDTEELLIDDCTEITKVEVGNDDYGGVFVEVPATGSGRYFTEPNNHVAKKVPIFKVTLNGQCFPCGKQNNRVTAKWGYSTTVPADIKFIATVFVCGILNQTRQGGDQVKSEHIGDYQVTYNTDNSNDSWADFERAKELLNGYMKLHI